MIAPLRVPDTCTDEEGRHLHEAHRVIAATLLAPKAEDEGVAPVRRWRVWLFVSWLVVVTCVYFVSMIGRL